METIIIQLHYCSREEKKQLIKYLQNNAWDYKLIPNPNAREDEKT